MAKYVKDNSRIIVKFIDGDTEELIFELKDRNWMNVGEILSTNITSDLIMNHFKNAKLPKKVMVIAVSECYLNND